MKTDSSGKWLWMVAIGVIVGALGVAAYWLTEPPEPTQPTQPTPPPIIPVPEDPVPAALRRDADRLRAAAKVVQSIRVSGDVEDPWVIAARELEVDALYDNQTGPINYFYRDEHFLQLEALLRGLTPAELRCIQVERRADLLKQAADAVLKVSRELETPEALRLLAEHLWDTRHLTQTIRADNRALEAVGRFTSSWAGPAVEIINKNDAESAKRLLRESYRSSVRDALVQQGWPWDLSPALIPSVSSTIARDTNITDSERVRRADGERARVQAAAVTLREIGDQRVKIGREWRALLKQLSGDRAKEVIESFSGFLDLPVSTYERFVKDHGVLMNERIERYLTTPAGFPERRERLVSLLKGFPEDVQSKITDELDAPVDVGRGQLNPTLAPQEVNSDGFRKDLVRDLDQSMALAAVDVGLTATALILFMAPEPIFTKIAGVVFFSVDTAIEAFQVRARWQRSTMVRLASVEAVFAMVFGTDPYSQTKFANATVVVPASGQVTGAVLEAELKLFNWLKGKARSWSR
jgi:hypothetical protein